MGQIKSVPLSAVRLPKTALRDVQSDSEDFKGLIESIKKNGFIGAIIVRQQEDAQTGATFYEVMDGTQRYGACMALGLSEINVDILSDWTEEEVLVGQIAMNAHSVATKPTEYCAQIVRILVIRPQMTLAQLAEQLGKSTQWIENIIKLRNIKDANIREMVDTGRMSLSNAYALAMLPEDEQSNFLDQALNQDAQTFTAAVKQRKRELDAARRANKKEAESVFVPVPHIRRMNVLKETLENPQPIIDLLNSNGCNDPQEAVTWALKWVMGLDPASVEKQKSDYEDRKKAAAEKAAQKQAEKEAKAAAEAGNLSNL